MTTIVTVFTDRIPTLEQQKLVRDMNRGIFEVMVDGIHRGDVEYLRKNITRGRLFKVIRGLLFSYGDNLDDVIYREPDFCIIPPPDNHVDWEMVKSYLSDILLGYDEGPYNLKEIIEMLPPPQKMEPVLASEPYKQQDNNDSYGLVMTEIKELDYMLYEVTKPYTDLPYTVLVREYTARSHLPFFSSLFVCSSWGVSSADVPFLENVWEYLEMPGIFNMDKILREATEACYPRPNIIPNAEPTVYRRSIKEVEERLRNGEYEPSTFT